VKLLWLAFAALLGRVVLADLARRSAVDIQIRTRRRHLHVARDGEVGVMRTPLHYRVRPRALRVIVPKGA
jgi:diacylglycerol kinase family enzyme